MYTHQAANTLQRAKSESHHDEQKLHKAEITDAQKRLSTEVDEDWVQDIMNTDGKRSIFERRHRYTTVKTSISAETLGNYYLVYLDDIVIFSRAGFIRFVKVACVLKRLDFADLSLNP